MGAKELNKQYITTSTAADDIDRTTRYIQQLIKLGKIPAYRIGRSYLIQNSDWADWKAKYFVKVKVK